jgi:hypothetical protein
MAMCCRHRPSETLQASYLKVLEGSARLLARPRSNLLRSHPALPDGAGASGARQLLTRWLRRAAAADSWASSHRAPRRSRRLASHAPAAGGAAAGLPARLAVAETAWSEIERATRIHYQREAAAAPLLRVSRRRVDEDGDAVLRDAFAELRRQEETEAPAFAAVLERTRTGTSASVRGVRFGIHRLRTAPPLSALAAVAVLVTVALGFWWWPRPRRAANKPALASWIAPTDFLLDTPAARLRSTPDPRGAALGLHAHHRRRAMKTLVSGRLRILFIVALVSAASVTAQPAGPAPSPGTRSAAIFTRPRRVLGTPGAGAHRAHAPPSAAVHDT